MKRRTLRLSLIVGLAAPSALFSANAVQADNPSWAEQQARNLELTRQNRQRPAVVAPEVAQFEKWKQEWMQQHPNEPAPTTGKLEHVHEAEINANLNARYAQMWQARQADLKQNYQRAKQNQERALTAQHVTWTPQQWQNWDREYDQQMRQTANDYLENVRQSGEFARDQAQEQQRHKDQGY
jgi:hypothetical protein